MPNNMLKKNTKLLSIVVPVYFNEESLPLLYEEFCKLEKQLLEREVSLELIFVDDGSEDNSLNQLFYLKNKNLSMKIIKHTRNFGALIAAKTGQKFANGDCSIVVAADLQDPIKVLPKMVDHWLNGSKHVIAIRKSRKDSIVTKFFSFIYYKILKILVVSNYPKGGFDLQLIDKKLFSYFQNSGKNTNPQLLAHWLGFNPKKVYYDRPTRRFGKSRWTFRKRFSLFLDSILGFSVRPIRIILTFGAMVSMVSFFYFIWIVINALKGKIPVQGFATIVSLISFLFGITISMLGIIGEYIWRIFDQVGKKPESVIEEIY